ncbi:hypothetical protein, partial [Caballeronia glebae]|uniref:hypothetical protein n=1 Tax=Caballeronia glebae TaxID=1777143 RepID=UPI0038BC97E5
GEVDPYLAKLQARVAKSGWRCLSKEWAGVKASYAFECAKGHRFERMGSSLYHPNVKCDVCRADENEARFLSVVAEFGGTLLGTFTKADERYRVRCAKGHEWESTGRNILSGHWCSDCHHEKLARLRMHADGMERIHAAAAERGGRCLADTYNGVAAYYPMECAQGHRWEAKGLQIMIGQWCRRCTWVLAGQTILQRAHPDGMLKLQEAARRQHGECLTTVYAGACARYAFRCAQGHEWMAMAKRIWEGSWCRQCAMIAQREPIENLRALAASRGGKCLSTETVATGCKLTWECHRGHVWQATPAAVKQKSWCPNCARLNRSKKSFARKRYDAEG